MSDSAKKPGSPDEVVASKPAATQTTMQALRAIVAEASPDLVPAVKWGQIVYAGRKNVCAIGGFKAHANLVFFRGDELADLESLLAGDGKAMRSIRFEAGTTEIANRDAIIAIIQDAVRLDGQ